MEHTYLKTIDPLFSFNYYKIQYKDIIDKISSRMLLQPQPNNFPEGNKKWELPHTSRPQQSILDEAYNS